LSDVYTTCARTQETLDLFTLIVRPEVQMQTVLDVLGFGDRSEDQPRKAIRRGPDLELLG
jgi:hypothetical protein